MRLTLHTDYALRTLLYIGARPTVRVSIREIAEAYGISENHLVKVVHRLGQGRFITTVRGRGGGLTLGRPAQDIGVGEVVRFTEDDMMLVDCEGRATGSRACVLSPSCRLRGVLGEALSAFLGVLDRYTLADLLQPADLARLFPELAEPPSNNIEKN
ncbi:Rrf2 family nitric oxide-sensitive transcriptional repressor [Gluconobacter cerinus]|uniref:Rrf2 family transcriptional regulator n=1 Tax=Gluconobacter TaxID=441 RepID=UPI002226A98A|nr:MULTISPECIES: Rrf2 family transcriptional regulator [Gluconobacter]MCW2265539.1 Rrf2 family nitric oxide-sensitive transcriptional repressor [Gluconobacter cerinus]